MMGLMFWVIVVCALLLLDGSKKMGRGVLPCLLLLVPGHAAGHPVPAERHVVELAAPDGQNREPAWCYFQKMKRDATLFARAILAECGGPAQPASTHVTRNHVREQSCYHTPTFFMGGCEKIPRSFPPSGFESA
jgi:hypothetical protein